MACDPCDNNSTTALCSSTYNTTVTNGAQANSNFLLSQRLLTAFCKLIAVICKPIYDDVIYTTDATGETTFAIPSEVDLSDATVLDYKINVEIEGLGAYPTTPSTENPFTVDTVANTITFQDAIIESSVRIHIWASKLITFDPDA